MRAIVMMFGLLVSSLAAEMEVRCYRMVPSVLDGVMREYLEEPPGGPEKVEEAGFESRFLEGANGLLDYTKDLRALLGPDSKAEGFYDPGEREFVMKAEIEDHISFAAAVNEVRPRSLRIKVTVFERPGVASQKEPIIYDRPPADAKPLAGVSGVGVSGVSLVMRTLDGVLEVETEFQVNANDDLVEMLLGVEFRDSGGESVSLKTGLTSLIGVMWFQEVGSSEGRNTIFVGIETEEVTLSGHSGDDWILKEEGGEFLREERFAGWRWPERLAGLENDDEIKVFSVPRGFLEVINVSGEISSVNDDPFAPVEESDDQPKKFPRFWGKVSGLEEWRARGLYDVREVLENNGLTFREGDFAVSPRNGGVIIMKAAREQMYLFEAMGCFMGPETWPTIQVELERWEGGEVGRIGGERMLERLVFPAAPGQVVDLRLGKNRHAQVEGQVDANDRLMELRVKLAGPGDDFENPELQLEFAIENGVALVVQEESNGGKREAWIARARVMSLDDELVKAVSR